MPGNSLNPSVVSERLRLARENCSMTQAQVAEGLNVARTTIVAIEKGQRKVKFPELRQFAQLYHCSLNSLVREEAVHVDLVPRFRRQFESQLSVGEEAANLMSRLAKAEVELENLLGAQRVVNYPLERPILPGDVESQAEQDALEIRQNFGLGQGPIHDIVSLLEYDMGVRLYIRKVDSKISGLFAFEDRLGACILLNGNHPKDRRKFTAAHELGHLIATRQMPEVLFEDGMHNSREERYANAFAKNFLLPSRALLKHFQEVTSGATQFTRRHVITIAHKFGTSRELTVRRLEELKALKIGTWDWFVNNGGITDQQAIAALGDLYINNRDQNASEKPTTLRLNALICQAWQQELLSEGQLSQLLGMDYHEIRSILDQDNLDGSDVNDAPSLYN